MKQSTRKRYSTGKRVKYSRVPLAHGGKPTLPNRGDYPRTTVGNAAFGAAYAAYQAALAAWNAQHNNSGGGDNNSGGGDNNSGGGDDNSNVPITGTSEQFEEERGKRVIQTGRTAEQISAGKIPEGVVPTAEVEKIEMEGTKADTVTLDPTQQAIATPVPQTVSETVALGEAKKGVVKDNVTGASYTAAKAGLPYVVNTAQGSVTREAEVDEKTLTQKTDSAEITDTEAAKGMVDKVTGTISDASTFEGQKGTKVQQEFVTRANAETRTGKEITTAELNSLKALAQERGINLEELPEYQKAASRTAQTGTAATKEGNVIEETAEEEAAKAVYYGADYTPQANNTEIDDTPNFKKAAVRTAQVAEAKTKIAQELGTAPSVDLEGREAITGTAPQGDAAQIGGIPTLAAAQMEAVQGKERVTAAADMNKVIADVPEETTAAIAEDPATVEAQIDEQPVEVTAAIAALPEEALVSTQMSGLLAGMEDGETPLWARPAVAAVNQMMAQRGLSASTVGRDALFNAIIQSALPIAQSNAQALQTRAQQNLSNQQSANLQQAQSSMQLRMQNLSNRQTAASQTADMAQQIKVQQGTFNQQAAMTTSQQRQDVNVLNAQMGQQRAQQESSQRQQVAISTLSVNAQMDLANLQAESTRAGKQLDADQQVRLTKYNAQVAKVMRQADLEQDMEKANLSGELQVEMQSISELNAAAKDRMTAEQTERLTNLQTLIDFRKTDANFAQQMDLANMSNEQQVELANLQEKAASDSANFTADNQFRLSELNAKV